MKRNPIDIIQEVVSRIVTTITPIDIFVNVDGTWTVTTCDPSYATLLVKLNGYQILSITPNGNRFDLIIKEEVSGTLNLDPPRYYHGTAVDTNQKMQSIETKPTRPLAYPMIYFPEVRSKTRYPKLTPIEMEADCRLIFAVNFKKEWNAEQLKDNCINPMLKLFDLFDKAIQDDPNIRVDNFDVEQYSRLGAKVEGQGTIYNAINDNCSGVVVEFTMSVNHDFICTCCCP